MNWSTVRRFVGLKLTGPMPDESTILEFRHRQEEHGLGETLFKEIRQRLERQGLRLSLGTIVDAETGLTHTVVGAPGHEHNVTPVSPVAARRSVAVWGRFRVPGSGEAVGESDGRWIGG